MLQLKNIKKTYQVAGSNFIALDGINLSFKKNEFVSILGASGSGKTTMLNLIGGLDRYTSGDLLIDGKSTKLFKDSNWDSYRNQTIGFVFQSYNLISHLSILDNVEMALRLSGVGQKERLERSKNALQKVGLIDHINKKPNQLSGGQMQRVAIARALVNDPKILLADEPTGALDTKTSIQIMKLIKEISKDRLVIMVTHNEEIAQKYSDRIVKLVDGKVVEDSNPVDLSQQKEEKLQTKKTSMNYTTALVTSFKNLLTKKGRTIITTLASSIGIIGVALVLSISTGMTNYTDSLQQDALAGYPLTITAQVQTDQFGPDGGGIFQSGAESEQTYTDENVLYAYDNQSSTVLHKNIISDDFIEYLNQMDASYYNSISYTSGIQLNVVSGNDNGRYTLTETTTKSSNAFGGSNVFFELPDNPDFILSQYDLIAGTYPENNNEVILVVYEQNQLDVDVIESLGLSVSDTYVFEDFLYTQNLKVIPNDVYYQQVMTAFIPRTDYQTMYEHEDSMALTVTGIIRIKEDASSEVLSPGIGYTADLTQTMLMIESQSKIVETQISNPNINVLTGLPYNTQITYDDVMLAIGGTNTPVGVEIYPVDFDSKDLIKAYLDEYNVGKLEVDTIIYTDLAEQVSSTISSLINTITIILGAFAGISLIVSSIMIGIITYVSVVERTKEIGIMRSLGARKKDVSRIFNAETILIGLSAGTAGIIIALLINIPTNIIINNLISVENFSTLTITNMLILIVLSTVLTFVAGLIPSRIASRKDPVIALRTE